MRVYVGDTIDWTLRGFHNRTGGTVNGFTVVDMPGRGLNFSTGRMPAFTNGTGITYDIQYRVSGSNQWHTLIQGVNAAAPFTFALPQPGNLHYSQIRFVFGTVPANFGLGDEIVLTFRVGNDAPNNTLINHFIVSHNGVDIPGESPYQPIVIIPRPPTNGNLINNGNNYFELDDDNIPMGQWTWDNDNGEWIFTVIDRPTPIGQMPQTGNDSLVYWVGSAIALMLTGGFASLIFIKANKNKTRVKK